MYATDAVTAWGPTALDDAVFDTWTTPSADGASAVKNIFTFEAPECS